MTSVLDTSLPNAGLAGVRGSDAYWDDFNLSQLVSSLPFTDDFSTALNVYSTVAGSVAVSGGKLTTTSGTAVYTAASVPDASVQADVDVTGSGSHQAGLVARYSGTGDTNLYLGLVAGTSGTCVSAILY